MHTARVKGRYMHRAKGKEGEDEGEGANGQEAGSMNKHSEFPRMTMDCGI